jgi:hypothetical protein
MDKDIVFREPRNKELADERKAFTEIILGDFLMGLGTASAEF